jgi:hypothetical protein
MKAWDMDATRFDSLTRTLRDVRSRRGALATLLSGTLAAVGVTAVADAKAKGKGHGKGDGDGKVKTQGSGGQKSKWRCVQAGKTCYRKPQKGSAREKRGCKHCCASVTILDGKKGRCCNQEGVKCATTEQCCLGVCSNGTCQGAVIQLPPPPPPNACGEGGPCLVFLSSTLHDGNLGGLSGADTTCQGLADAAGLPGTYKAWLSDGINSISQGPRSPSSRFVRSSGPYQLVNGTTIAANWADLTDGALLAAIGVTEVGGDLGSTENTWTQTNRNGRSVFPDESCKNFTSAATNTLGFVGSAAQVGQRWTEHDFTSCNESAHLYCFQQPAGTPVCVPINGVCNTQDADRQCCSGVPCLGTSGGSTQVCRFA